MLAADVGTKRIGVAVCDASRRFVFPRGVVPRDMTGHADVSVLAAMARDEGAVEIVVGLPLNVDGSEGPAAAAARAFGVALSDAAKRPVQLVDERYTSMEADEALRIRFKDPRARKDRVDAAAAALILRTFIEHGPVGA